MKIKIEYTLYTDGDYCLENPDKFGCTGRDVISSDGWEHYDYVGSVEFQDDEEWSCKMYAKDFLCKFLCDGIHVLYTHAYLIKDFYDMIESLEDAIDDHKNFPNTFYASMSGNYDGTEISVTISE